MEAATSATSTPGIISPSAVALRPVIFVVDATHQQQEQRVITSPKNADEPFDVRGTTTKTTDDATTLTGATAASTDENIFDTFLAALQGKLPGDDDTTNNIAEDELSLAASFASSSQAPPTPRDDLSEHTASPIHSTPKRFASPFSRLRVGRWRATTTATSLEPDEQTATTAASSSTQFALAHDMENDPDDNDNATTNSTTIDSVSTALSSYSKDNPPVNFMSKRARVVSVSGRHAFPPSKFPKGKMDSMTSGDVLASGVGNTVMLGEHTTGGNGNNWISSYEIENEGILPIGWLEKHARALPSAIIIVTTFKLENENEQLIRSEIKNAKSSVNNIRLTLAEKRSVPIHLVCLINEEDDGAGRVDGVGPEVRSKKNLNAIKERICQECYLPQSQVFMIRTPCDLEPDEFESGILRSPYLGDGVTGGSSATGDKVMMNPLLRQLDRSLRDTSVLYYSHLAEAQERKLMLWRNRYHNTNSSFEVNTLLAAMRCARYAMKVGTLREFQMRTGGTLTGQMGTSGRWMDKSSLAMRHYDEAYRWVMELHRRAITWRAMSLGSGGGGSGTRGEFSFQSPGGPATPGHRSSDGNLASPQQTQSPGGGIGLELSYPYPGAPAAPTSLTSPPPPPMRRDSPGLTSKQGYNTPDNIAFFALLWEQCRAVASIINAKLLRTTSSSATSNSFGAEAEDQWRRHCIFFLSNPHGINLPPSQNDDFFGPAWRRFVYFSEELLTYACIAEGRWRRAATSHMSGKSKSLTSSYHQPGAPWKVYGELCEATLGLRQLVVKQMGDEEYSTEWMTSTLSRRQRFVGSIVAGDSGIGTLPWQFDNESKRDHRGVALDYVLHALDLLDENTSICRDGGVETSQLLPMPSNETPTQQPKSSARLHYLAGRLLMGLNDPSGALVHLNIASAQTKSWPSLHLAIYRALCACNERCSAAKIVSPNSSKSKETFIEMLLQSDSCKLLSPMELKEAQSKAWKSQNTSEVVWNDDDKTKGVPFEFAVSFLKATHATSSDTVKACVSIKSCLNFPVKVESLQLLTTSGIFDVPNLEKCALDRSQLQSCLRGESNKDTRPNQGGGVHFNCNDLVYFMTELTLPANLSDIALGGTDMSKFIPKNGRLCNMGLSHAAGSICESRFNSGNQQKISMTGKAIPISSISEASSLFLGGIPLACHGVVLTLKNESGDSSIKLQVDRQSLVSSLFRSGTQRAMMEESNYTVHSWSRPSHHPWCLGPRVLRVLGPRPHMHVTNLTDPQTNGCAVEGAVNRIMLRLDAGSDEECFDVRVRLKCKSSKKQQKSEPPSTDATATTAKDETIDVEPHRMPTFVCKSDDPTAKVMAEGGFSLPTGWEPRKDVGTDESHDVTTSLSHHLEVGKSLLCPLDIFRPLDSSDSDPCSTSYDVVIMYRQVRAGEASNKSSESTGDEVMVVQSGSIEWITPFTAEFSQSNGFKKPFPCGIQHASNMVLQPEPSVTDNELVVADGQQVNMRCSLQAKGLGSNVTATILSVTNTKETDEKQKVLYSSDSGLFMNQTRLGSKFSLSYSVRAQKDIECAKNETIPLGIISVDWKPASLNLPPDDQTPISTNDEFGYTHGPLSLPNLAPMVFCGPLCQVLPSPFSAKLLKCPSTPKVGVPFAITYQVTNKTAKCQTLVLRMNDTQDGDTAGGGPQLLGTGKLKEESLLAPFEEKTFSFTFMSMAAGQVMRPPLTISSGRHQSWIINEAVMPQNLFVMP